MPTDVTTEEETKPTQLSMGQKLRELRARRKMREQFICPQKECMVRLRPETSEQQPWLNHPVVLNNAQAKQLQMPVGTEMCTMCYANKVAKCRISKTRSTPSTSGLSMANKKIQDDWRQQDWRMWKIAYMINMSLTIAYQVYFQFFTGIFMLVCTCVVVRTLDRQQIRWLFKAIVFIFCTCAIRGQDEDLRDERIEYDDGSLFVTIWGPFCLCPMYSMLFDTRLQTTVATLAIQAINVFFWVKADSLELVHSTAVHELGCIAAVSGLTGLLVQIFSTNNYFRLVASGIISFIARAMLVLIAVWIEYDRLSPGSGRASSPGATLGLSIREYINEGLESHSPLFWAQLCSTYALLACLVMWFSVQKVVQSHHVLINGAFGAVCILMFSIMTAVEILPVSLMEMQVALA